MGYKLFEGDYEVSKPICEDPSTLPEEFLCFALSIGLCIYVGVCDVGTDVTCGGNDGSTCKCDVWWPVKEFGTPHTLMMHLIACEVSMIGDITRKVKA